MDRSKSGTVLSDLPSVDRVLQSRELRVLLESYARDPVLRVVRQVLQRHREAPGESAPTVEVIARQVAERIAVQWVQGPGPVINATGVVLHTNLGRAPLSSEALWAMREAAAYSDLEYDAGAGTRGSRQDHVRDLLVALTGAESALVTVNAAAAMILMLTALARGREVIVSRGQAVEIGGGFRVPAILRQGGARLVEVGTTNRTRLDDYAEAISSKTAAILHVHASNFRIIGFTEDVDLRGLARLAHSRGVLCLDDNGSGSLLDTSVYGLRHEPTPLESLRAGVDLVAFSGDKLLGGPQAGIVLGRADLLQSVGRNPLARAVRPDKIVLAALSATLVSYLHGNAQERLPLWRMIGQTDEDMARRADAWRSRAAAAGLKVEVRPGQSTVGGGSLPGECLPTSLIVLPSSITAVDLRRNVPPIVARTADKRVLLDLRTVPEEQESLLLDAVTQIDRQKNAVVESDAR